MPDNQISKVTLGFTTAADGSATVVGRGAYGVLCAIAVDKGTCDATLDITCSLLGGAPQTVLTLTDVSASAVYYVRGNACGNTGTAGTDGMQFIIVDGQPKIVVAQGGNVKTGSVTFYYMEIA